MASVSSGLACKQKTSAFRQTLSISKISGSFSIAASLCLQTTTIIVFVILVVLQTNNGVVFGQVGDSSIDNQLKDENRLLASYQVDNYDNVDDGRQHHHHQQRVTSLERLSPFMTSIDSANNNGNENQFANKMRADSEFVVTQQPVSDPLMLQAPTFVVSPSSEMYATAAAPPPFSQQQQVHSIGNIQQRQQVIPLQQPHHIMITAGPASQFSDSQQSRNHISPLPPDVLPAQTANDAYIGEISSQQPTVGQVFTMPSNKRSLQSLLFGSKSGGLMSKSRSQKLVGDVGKLVGLATTATATTTTGALNSNSKQMTSDEQRALGDIPISFVVGDTIPTTFTERLSDTFGLLGEGVRNHFRSISENFSDTVDDLKDTWTSARKRS